MKTTLSHRLPMIPRLTVLAETQEDYAGWELLEADARANEILICKPCTAEWSYTRSKHLLILCGEVAANWQRKEIVA